MTKQTKKILEQKCDQCQKSFSVWADGLDSDLEQTEEMKNHSRNYCPACVAIRNLPDKLT